MFSSGTTHVQNNGRIAGASGDINIARGTGAISSELINAGNAARTSFVKIPSVATVNVEMGYSVTLHGCNTTLSTRSLSDCSALAVLSDWNGQTYGTRTLMHLTGSNLENGLADCDAFELLGKLKDSLARGGKVILVGGVNSQSDVGLAVTLGQSDRAGNQPLLNLLKIQDVSITLAGASGIDVKADGTFTLRTDIGRGVLNKDAVNTVLEFI
jgi:hypothetical protein